MDYRRTAAYLAAARIAAQQRARMRYRVATLENIEGTPLRMMRDAPKGTRS